MSRGISANQRAILAWMDAHPGYVITVSKAADAIGRPTLRASVFRALRSLERRQLRSRPGFGTRGQRCWVRVTDGASRPG